MARVAAAFMASDWSVSLHVAMATTRKHTRAAAAVTGPLERVGMLGVGGLVREEEGEKTRETERMRERKRGRERNGEQRERWREWETE